MAALTWTTVTCCVLFICSSCFWTINARLIQPHILSNEVNIIRQNVDANVHSRIYKRDILSRLTKRDSGAQDPVCASQEGTFQSNVNKTTKFLHEYSFANETKFTMALAWAGLNTGVILVVTTEEYFIFARPSTLYRSEDNGKTFIEINDRVSNAYIRKDNGLQKHPFKPERIFIVAHNHQGDASKSLLFLTSDGGKTFTSGIVLPFLLDADIIFHPSEKLPDYMMALSHRNQELYLSKDGGTTWHKIHDRVVNVKWSTSETDANSPGTVYVAYRDVSPEAVTNEYYKNILAKSTDFGEKWTDLVSSVHNFGSQGKFLYTSVMVPTQDSKKRLMKVSTDGGKTWNEAQLPTITSEQFYSILDMTEGLIFIHVDNPGDTGHGTLYTSDATGIVFSQSLEKHLYPNYQDVTDFYKVKSLRGVYLASQMSQDQSIHTVISFNRGAEWKAVNRPIGGKCKDETKACNLQIHNMYSIRRGVTAQPPLSSETATGIILVHGHIADALQTTPPDVFVSSDGGYSWRKSLDGPHHYQIADHGGLLVAVPANTSTPNVVKFSTDEGRCWHTYKFTDVKLIFTGLLTEPGNKAMTVGIWGYGAEDRKWRVYVIDFKEVINRQCGAQDYETWTAHGDMSHDNNLAYQGCLLGKREEFKRLKKDSWCYNGYSYEVQKQEKVCECTTDDYECDYGYIRYEGSSKCIKDPKFKGPVLDICLRGHVEKLVSEGYRRIPGDVCVGGYKPQSDKLIDVHKQCVEGSKLTLDADLGIQTNNGSHKANATVIIAVVMIVLLLSVILVIFFVHKFNLLRTKNVTYKYSVLSQQSEEYDYDNDFENALTSRKELYEDTSDEEILENARRESSRTPRSMNAAKVSKIKQYHDDSDDDMLE